MGEEFPLSQEYPNFPPSHTVGDLAQQYEMNRFVFFPALLAPKDVNDLLRSTEPIPSRRVICHDEAVSWAEQTFERGHMAFDFFETQPVASLVCSLAGKLCVDKVVSWTSKYQKDEHIDPHRDRAGTIQLLVCLEAPELAAQGGALVVGATKLQLTPGDAVAFEATKLEHYTTPLLATKADPEPQRTVLVGRYFLR